MNQCTRCHGFVPPHAKACPNCRSRRALWVAPLAFVGAGLAACTISALYGPACAGNPGKLPDGGDNWNANACGFDCQLPLGDGGDREQNKDWLEKCEDFDCTNPPTPDGGAYVSAWEERCRAGVAPEDAGTNDAGTSDAGVDGGN